MGMSERLMVNFENITIEYKGKKIYILKQFEYNKVLYLYGMDIETINSIENSPEFVFLYRIDGDIFKHIEDEKTWNKLFDIVSGLCAGDIVKESLNEFITSKRK